MKILLLFLILLPSLVSYPDQTISSIQTNSRTNTSTNTIVQANTASRLPRLIFSRSDIIDASKVDLSKYVFISKFDGIDVSSESNVTIINFRGGVKLSYQDKKLRCNSLTVFIVDNEVREVIGEGDVKFVSGKDLFEGKKFFYDIKSGKISLYEARTKLDDRYYYADIMKQLDSNKFFFENVYFTKSDLLFPTYRVNAYRAWYYRGDYLLTLNNSYIVGQGAFLYFPTFYELQRYTDILTDFGVERTIGFYVQNTFYPRRWFGESLLPRLKIKFDHYERLGEYLGFEVPSITLISNLTISAIVDFEYDKKYEYNGKYIVNYIDQYGKNDFREYRTFGWHYNLRFNYTVAGISASFTTEDLNDPFLPYKFSSRREKFDIRKFVFPNENIFWSPPGPKQNITRSLRASYQYGISSFSLGLDWVYQLRSGYSLTNTNSFGVVIIENKTNKYANDYYRYDLQRLSGPYISYSANLGNIISLTYEEKITNVSTNTNVSTTQPIRKYLTNETIINRTSFEIDLLRITTNYVTNVSTNVVEQKDVNTNLIQTNILTNIITVISTNLSVDTNRLLPRPQTNLITTNLATTNLPLTNLAITNRTTNINFSTNVQTFKWFQLNISPSASVSITPNSVYRIEDGTPIEDTFNHRESIGVSSSLGLFDNIISIASSLGIQNNSIWTRTDNPIRKKQDDLNSLATLSLGNSMSIGRVLFGDTLLLVEPRISVSHNISYRLTKPKLLSPDEDPYIDDITSHGVGVSASLRLLNLSLLSNAILNFFGFSSIVASSGISYNLLFLKSEIKYRDDKTYWTNKISNPITVNISFGPLLSYRVSYRITLSNDNVVFDPVGSGFSGSISFKDLVVGFLVERITYINIGYGLNFDYKNPINNVFSLSFSVGGIIDENWSFAMSTGVVNNKIYRYVPEYAQRYNVPSVSLVQDILDAINIFDINALRRTFFKNTGVTVSIIRDLYDWTASLSSGIRLYKDEARNFAFFEPFVSFEVKSKKSIGVEVPAIQPELYRLFE